METPTQSTKVSVRLGGIAPVAAAFLLGCSLIAATHLATKTYYKVKSLSNVVSVTGSSEKVITSDTVKWTSNFSRTVPNAEIKTGAAQMKADLEAVKAVFHAAGVTDAQITIDPMTVSAVCDNQQNVTYDKYGNQGCLNQSPNWKLQQNIRVESDKVAEVTKLAQDAVNALIDKGVLFSSQNVEYYYAKLADLKVQMFADATKDAQARAEKIAESTGAHIGQIQSVSTGVLQVTPVNSTDFSDYGSYDTTSREKKVTSVVHASFLLQ